MDVALITLGCARNEVDSEELAARFAADGMRLVESPDSADVVVVNTCGFVDAAKKDSIDTILAASSETRPVIAVGCLAERYGKELAQALPEAAAVLGFDSYPHIAQRVRSIVSGESIDAHDPRDRRTLLPVTPVERARTSEVVIPGHGGSEAGWSPPFLRFRREDSPVAPVKLASGCDRRCSFCAIPSFRGSFVSRPPQDVIAEVAWLSEQGVREVNLVSENSTSYGKDLGDLRLLESLLPELAASTSIGRIRVAYLQPAEVRPGLVQVMAREDAVASYFDLSFQHASASVLRRMRRFGDGKAFLDLIGMIRSLAPRAGIRSNVIVGFPGETDEDFEELLAFLEAARLDAIGVFGYSDEEGTEAAKLEGKNSESVIAERVRRASDLAEELMNQRAEARVGETLRVLIERQDADQDADHELDVEWPEGADWVVTGHADHQGPDDGATYVWGRGEAPDVGSFVYVTCVATEGVDCWARIDQVISSAPGSSA